MSRLDSPFVALAVIFQREAIAAIYFTFCDSISVARNFSKMASVHFNDELSSVLQIAGTNAGVRAVWVDSSLAPRKSYATVPELCFQSEVHRVRLKRHPNCGFGPLRTFALGRRATWRFCSAVKF